MPGRLDADAVSADDKGKRIAGIGRRTQHHQHDEKTKSLHRKPPKACPKYHAEN
jgi:hypothetical protein